MSKRRSWLGHLTIGACLVFMLGAGEVHAAPAAVTDPPLPSSLSAWSETNRVVVRYCFASLPKGRRVHPALINVGVDNTRDKLPALTLSWPIKNRCGTVRQPVGPVKPPYKLLISVGSPSGNLSKIVRIEAPRRA
jgi:hypothetical protein